MKKQEISFEFVKLLCDLLEQISNTTEKKQLSYLIDQLTDNYGKDMIIDVENRKITIEF